MLSTLKQTFVKILITIFIIHLLFNVTFLALNGHAAVMEIDSDYGFAPEIDGDIDKSNSEWKNATKEEIQLTGVSPTDKGILVDLWVMQNESDLYISVQFELETHKSTEYVGIVISESGATSNDSFVDAKILQFTDLGTVREKHQYIDYYVLNNQFFEDRKAHGDAAAKLKENKIVYEFQIPTNNSDDAQDATLDFGDTYAFKIIYSEKFNDPGRFIKSQIVLIEIDYNKPKKLEVWILYHNILCIIIFCGLIALFALYIYKITVIKKKIKRITE